MLALKKNRTRLATNGNYIELNLSLSWPDVLNRSFYNGQARKHSQLNIKIMVDLDVLTVSSFFFFLIMSFFFSAFNSRA